MMIYIYIIFTVSHMHLDQNWNKRLACAHSLKTPVSKLSFKYSAMFTTSMLLYISKLMCKGCLGETQTCDVISIERRNKTD